MKALLSILVLTTSISLYGQKQLKFEILDQMPNGVVAFGYAHSKDNIFAIGGTTFNKEYTSNMQVYDAKINSWFKVPLKKISRHRYSSAIYIDDYKGIIVAGGTKRIGNSIRLIDEINIIYPDDFKVDLLGTIPEPAKKLAIAHDKGIVYLFGGGTSRRESVNGPVNYTFSNKFYSYDLKNGVVNELPDLPVGMETSGGIYNGNLYAFGGFSGRSLTSVWQYDIDKKNWNKLRELTFPVSANAVAQFKNYFILVGDYHRGRQLIVYDVETQKSTYFTTNIPTRHSGASVIDGYLHVYGGLTTEGVSHYKIPLSELISVSN